MNIRHLIVPAVLAVFSAAVIWLSLQLDISPPMIVGKSMQPRSFPIFLMVLNLILVAFLTVQIYRSPPAELKAAPFATWGSILIMCLFYILTVTLDMFIGIALSMFLLALLWGERRWLVATATALITPLLIFLLFDNVLKIRFPRGVLTNWYYG
jgi:uncharacterized membrane protein